MEPLLRIAFNIDLFAVNEGETALAKDSASASKQVTGPDISGKAWRAHRRGT